MSSTVSGVADLFQSLWVVLAIVWLLVPFAIFGIKPRLDKIAANQTKLIEQQRLTNEWLAATFKEHVAGNPKSS